MLNKITFFLLGIIGFTLFLASSIPLQLIASSLNLFLPGTLQVSHITGNIFGPIRFGSLNYDSASTHIHAHSIKVKWSHLGGFPGQVRISSFHIKQLKIQHHSSQQGAPQSIGFPLKLAIPNLVIDQFSFNHTQLHKIHANIDINHNRYRFKQIKAVWNQSQLLLNGSLGSKKPFNINTNIEIHSSFTTMKASLTGSLCRLLLKATGKSEKGTATVYAKLALFNPQVIHDLALQTNRLDLHYLDKKLPLTELTTKAYLHSTNQGAQGYFIVQNSLTGSLTQNKTPISSIHGTVSLQKDLLRIPTFKIALDANGTLTGKARINAKHQDVTIDVTKLNLKAFYPKLYNTKLNGTIHIIRKTPSAHILVYLHGNKIRLKSNLALNHDYIIINKFKLLKNKSVISAKGQFGLNHHHFMLSGFLLNFNPANFGSYITANLGAHFKANGSFKPTPIIYLALKINSKSTLNHHPFTGHVFLTWQHTLTSTDIALILGHNHFSLEGGLSKGHTLHLDANLTALQELGPDFSGHIQAKGNASGAWNHLVSTLHIRGNDIHLPHHISITGIKGDLKIGQAPTAPFKIHVALKKLAVAHHIFPAFLVKIGGTRSNHTGIITLSTPAEKISSRFSGSFQNRRWTGFIQTFTGQGLYNTYLLSPARVKISSQQQNVTNLALNLNGGTIHLSKFLKTSTALHIQGSIHNLPASIIETLPLKLPVQSEGLKINSQFNFTTGNSITGHVTLDIPTGDVRITSLHKRLKLKALHLSCTILNNHFITKVFLKSGLIHAVALTVQGNLTLAHKKPVINFNDPIKTSGYAKNFNTQVLAMIDPHPSLVIDHNLVISSNWNLTYKTGLKGQLSIERNSGNLTFSGLNGGKLPINFQKLSFTGQFIPGNALIHLKAQAKHIGSLKLDGTLPLKISLTGIHPNRSSKINLQTNLKIYSLSFLPTILNKTDVITQGELTSDILIKGTVNNPVLSGAISGKNLRVALPNTGLTLEHGTFDTRISGNELYIHDLDFDSSKGHIAAQGPIIFGNRINAALNFTFTHIPIFDIPKQRIIVSGNTLLKLSGKNVQVTGKLVADSGKITLENLATPSLGPDVVIIGKKVPRLQKSPPLPVNLDILFDLGKDFTLQGHGIRTRLIGHLQIHSKAGSPIQLFGTIHSLDGTYAAYGQNLSISKGDITFHGPTNDPALNISAIRKNLQVQAGVAITGSAQHPVIRLISTPEVSDSEKLSWLVLGHGLSSANSNDMGTLGLAAAQLLTSGAAMPLGKNIANFVGLNQLSVSGTGNLQTTVINLGKQFTKHINIGYSQSLTGGYSINIRYLLDRYWSIETSSGLTNSINLLFTHSFD